MADKDRILVVDDDQEICMMVKLILDYNGFSVTTLQRADQVAGILNREPVQLILLDMLIGGVRGTDVCLQLKADPATASIPIIMMTALPDAEKICREAGANDFVPKPFEIDQLISKVKETLR